MERISVENLIQFLDWMEQENERNKVSASEVSSEYDWQLTVELQCKSIKTTLDAVRGFIERENERQIKGAVSE